MDKGLKPARAETTKIGSVHESPVGAADGREANSTPPIPHDGYTTLGKFLEWRSDCGEFGKLLDAGSPEVAEFIATRLNGLLDQVKDQQKLIEGQRSIIARVRDQRDEARVQVKALREALEPFARIPKQGKRGGEFVIGSASYTDQERGNQAAPREAYFHWEDVERARQALNSQQGEG